MRERWVTALFPSARSAAGSEWMGHRMWSETEGEVRLEVPEHRGLSGGVEMAWRHRVDAVRGTTMRTAPWLGRGFPGANRAWSVKPGARGMPSSAGQAVYSEQGWDTYRYNHVVCEGRLEQRSRRWGLRRWWIAAVAVERPVWMVPAIRLVVWLGRCGIVWQASTAPRWERRHALKRRIPVGSRHSSEAL